MCCLCTVSLGKIQKTRIMSLDPQPAIPSAAWDCQSYCAQATINVIVYSQQYLILLDCLMYGNAQASIQSSTSSTASDTFCHWRTANRTVLRKGYTYRWLSYFHHRQLSASKASNSQEFWDKSKTFLRFIIIYLLTSIIIFSHSIFQ